MATPDRRGDAEHAGRRGAGARKPARGARGTSGGVYAEWLGAGPQAPRVLCYAHPGVGTGVGGTIPFVEPFARAFAGAPALLLGVEDPDSHTHDVDESLHLADGRAACLAEACLFAELASVGRPTGAGGPR